MPSFSSESAPAATAEASWRSETAAQMQTYIDSLQPQR
jgi:hypothetical protein